MVAVDDVRLGHDADVVSIVVEVTEIEPHLAATSAAAGDIGLADLRAVAVPVGPGGGVTGSCTPNGVSGTGYDAVHTLTCTFDDVPPPRGGERRAQ